MATQSTPDHSGLDFPDDTMPQVLLLMDEGHSLEELQSPPGIQSYDMDIGRVLAAQPFSTLTVGSEFQPTQILEPLFGLHPLWP
jgi:hypothetical protein